ncbi:unnamed protein product [Trifolium pratense]|uniref:Uncharacterized protein n=1 Tax=Trifolium pratense TaxID=57577 RepID=A0ACB0J0K3_TRIPR|nr:unnamed protein product [Trifolium pratense]
MSDSVKSSPSKTNAAPSTQKEVINAIPLNSIPFTSPKMRRKSVAKKERSSRANPSSPSSSIKKSKKKSKKSRTESSKSYTMSELHVDPLPSSDAPTPVVDATEDNVDTSGKNSLNQNSDAPNSVENLGLEKPTVSENLGKSVPNSPVADDDNIGASTETNNPVANESIKKTAPETHVAPNVATHGAAPNVVPDVTTSLAQENLVDYSESDESPPPKDTDKEAGSDKVVNETPEVIIVNENETTVSDKAIPAHSEASVARRTRSRINKGVETASTPVQTPKPSKAGKATGKKPVYGPPKPVSKVIPRSETKKRKAPPTSDSDFEPETDVAASGSTSRKSIGRKKVPQTAPYAPLDNVSFHLENGSARWKFVYHRRLALERNLKNDILECPSVVEALEYAGLMKTVVGLDKCYDRLVKEFLINVAADCNDPASPEYRQVFVRGKCVQFSPIVINQYLQRSSDEVAPLKATDNEICKVLTGGKIKVWPSKAKLSATSLSPFYAVLNRIAAHNWVPTTHSGDIARGLASARSKKKKITKLVDEAGTAVHTQEDLCEVAKNYFNALFKNISGIHEPVLNHIQQRVTEEDNYLLMAPLTKIELQQALFQMHPDKSPGPDGFNPAFYQRLKFYLDKCVSQEQSAFVEGRSILDNARIAIEVIHAMKRKTRGYRGELALKIDISKAYDKVDWGFLRVLMNFDKVGPITPGRGLQQGDPLSPYLFILVAEGLSALIHQAVRKGDIHGVRICRGAHKVSHLLFADECFLFCRANVAEVTQLLSILYTYEQASGQEINLSKSEVFISRNMSQAAQADLAGILGVRHVLGTGIYLGLPSMVGRSKKAIFSYIKYRIWKRINSWRGRALSKAGKEIMIKSVLQAIPAYVMSMFILPSSFIDDIEKMINAFWWGRGNGNSKARELVESMAQNEYRATNDRGAKKKGGVLELDTQTALLAQQKLMTSQMEAMMKLLSNPQVQTSPIGKIDNVRCDFCLQDHPNGGCFPEGSEEARYLANFRKPYNNNNNGSGWGNGMQGQGGFGGNTHDNPKNETCNGITLRSREIPERPAVEKPLKKKVNEGEVENKQEVEVENERREGEVENENLSKEVEISEDEEDEVEKQREIKEKKSKKMLTRLTGKGKKKSDANPPQEPPKKPRTKMSASKGQSSRSAQASPPRRSNVTRPQVHPHFISEVHEKRYSQIRTFTINQEKGFGEDLLKGVAELGNEIRSRGWERFNKLMIKDDMNPGNQMWAREFFANAYLPDQPMFPEYVSVVRGVKVSYSFETINNLLGCAAGGVCELLRDRERIDKSGIEVREELKNIVCRPGAMWLAHSAASLPRRLSLTSFNPIHRAWGEFWLKNVRVVGNNSEIQLDNAHAVRLLVEGKFINLGYWLQKDLHEIANHPNPTFTLGHCNLIAALCRANNVPMNVQEGDLHPVRPLSLSYFIKKFERGPIVPRGEGNAAREEALREEEEINRFEEGNHPDQQGDPAYESQEIPGHAPPRYSHDMNQLASMLHQMEISQYSGLPNLYFDTASSMYTEAMTYRSTFPPPTFGTLYPVDTDWEAHQARELNSFQARQAYNSGLRTSELAEIERRRRVEQDEAAAMEREMLDVDGLNLNLNSPFTNYFTGQPDDAV